MKYWEQTNDGVYKLHFNPYNCEDMILLKFCTDKKDKTVYYFVSEVLEIEGDYQRFDSIEDAKEEFEYMVRDYFQEQLNYYEELLEKFEEGE